MCELQPKSDEIVARGEEIYERDLRAQLESEHHGRYLALDVGTCEYEIDDDMLAAIDQVKAKRSDASIYVARIGFPSAVTLGSGMRVAPR